MPTLPITRAEAMETLEAVRQHMLAGKSFREAKTAAAGDLRGRSGSPMTYRSVDARMTQIRQRYGLLIDWKTGEISQTEEGRIKSARQGYAPTYDLTHEIPDGMTSKGPSIRYDGQGNIDQYWNKLKIEGCKPENAVRLADPKKIVKLTTLLDQERRVTLQWVSEKPEDQERERLWMLFAKELAAPLPRLDPVPIISSYNDSLMTVIPFGDPHFGLYCWKEEVGEDFDLDIARRDLCAAVDYLVSQAPPAKRCLIASVGDFYHADNLDAVTPQHGNRLDVDTRLGKVIRVGLAAMRQAITSALRRHAVVEVIAAPGNHDPVLSLALAVMLANIYENEPRVIIHDAPTKRHYVRHGKVLIGVTHGDKGKDSDLPGIMATERPEDWGLTKYRYFFRGHHHHDERIEFNGCTVEQVRTLAPADAYSNGLGLLAGRDMKLIVLHAEYGEVSRTTCSIDLLRDLRAAA